MSVCMCVCINDLEKITKLKLRPMSFKSGDKEMSFLKTIFKTRHELLRIVDISPKQQSEL